MIERPSWRELAYRRAVSVEYQSLHLGNMKRIADREAYKRHQRRRTRHVLAQRERHQERTRALGLFGPRPLVIRGRRITTAKSVTRVVAPGVLSVAQNPEGCNEFFNKLAHLFEKKRATYVDLANVEQIGYDAMLVLLAILIRFQAEKIGFNGNQPRNAEAQARLKQSGFFKTLLRGVDADDSYDVTVGHRFVTHGRRRVEAALTAKILEEASQNVWHEDRRFQGVQRVLIELMQNTNNHAFPGRQGEKHWWLSVAHRKSQRTTSFVFVDFGVGIFKSLDTKTVDSKWYRARDILLAVFSVKDNAEVLKLILEGQLHQTVTREPYRGKGLPGIREALSRNWMSNLLVVTNDVYADVPRDDFRTLSREFPGTLVAWEVSDDNRSTK